MLPRRSEGIPVLSDFPTDIVNETSHRPWPLPEGPWIMTQTWHDLLFAHWPVAADVLREKLPPGLDVDLFDSQAWLGIIPFHLSNVAPRGVPAVPWVSTFAELNVRTYVRHHGVPGVFFFSLDAGSPLAVTVARAMFHLPYFNADIQVERDGAWVSCRSRRLDDGAGACLDTRYRPVGPVQVPAVGTLEHFLTERYCLFTLDGSFHVRRLDIHHLPWRLQAADAAFEANTMAEAAGLRLPSLAPLLHFSKRQDMVGWPLRTPE